MKIVITDAKTLTNNDVSLDIFYGLGDVTLYPLTSSDELLERVIDADAILCNKSLLTEDILRSCKNLKYIGLFATGYNNVDVKVATELGITVCNAGEYSTMAVVQHTFALILELVSCVSNYHKSVANGDWVYSETFSYFLSQTSELFGMTLGVVGFGSIGKAVAKVGAAFGMNVIVSTRTVPVCDPLYDGYEFVSMDELFSRADVLTLHCPLTDKTANLICKENLAKMKKTAILINTSRGGVVCERDLCYALENNIIAGAGIDVISVEPMTTDNPLRNADNCIITPHIAWAPKQTRERLIQIVAKNIRCYLDGKPINVVKG